MNKRSDPPTDTEKEDPPDQRVFNASENRHGQSPTNPSTVDRAFAHASQKLYQGGLLAWVAGLAFLLWRTPQSNPLIIFCGLGVYSLGIWPALLWARNARVWFPVFEIFMLVGVAFYAIPILAPESDALTYSEDTVARAVFAVLAFQVVAFTAFQQTRGRIARSSAWVKPLVNEGALRFSQIGLWLNTLYLFMTTFMDAIPYEATSILRAVFLGVGTISMFAQTRLWGLKQLKASDKVVVAFNLFLQCTMMASELYLIGTLSLLALSFIGYMTASRKVPLLIGATALGLLAVLHNGKSEMRKIYWHNEVRNQLNVSSLPVFYGQWLQLGLAQTENTDSRKQEDTASLLQRASLFQIVLVTVDTVPQKRPYLDGETYMDVPAQFVPRIFWPNKPTSLESNVRLALYFGLVSEYSAQSVSIAFGMLAEAYANFGFFGVCGLGYFFGHLFKRISVAAQSADLFSPLGLFVIILTAWSLQVEMVSATWFSSLFQASIVSVILPKFAFSLLGKH